MGYASNAMRLVATKDRWKRMPFTSGAPVPYRSVFSRMTLFWPEAQAGRLYERFEFHPMGWPYSRDGSRYKNIEPCSESPPAEVLPWTRHKDLQ
jgi:hypothetical protein